MATRSWSYAEEILRKHGIRLDTATLKAMIDAQIKEMENMEPFYLADAKGGNDQQSEA